ncbi:ATP-binding protein, partial [Sulfurimonas sp.]|nr:ATP-binding protein [Sulfurimonas sp.]
SLLTKSFSDLSSGKVDIKIPEYKVKDEVGELTKAAEIFLVKNIETNELLESTKELTNNLALSEERFSLALEGAQDGLWDWNLITDEVYYSDTWKKMFGYELDDIKDSVTEWKDRIHKDDLQKSMRDIQDYLDGKKDIYESEMRIRCKDESYKIILAKGKAIHDESGYVIRILGLHMDITEQKELEKNLTNAKIEADQANKAKSDFLANMSHEIRTPLNGIIGLTDIVLNSDLSTKQKELLLKSKVSSLALLRVINDILDYSKIEAGKLDLEMHPFDLSLTIQNIKDLFEYQANHKGIGLNINFDVTSQFIIGDSLRLTQVLTNLVGNAIKFTSDGYVSINVKTLSEYENIVHLEFCVEDSGIGLSRDAQDNLFKKFSQADNSTTRKYGGTGLGLSISKQLVNMMDGDIWIESIEGKGSKFIFNVEFEKSNRESINQVSETIIDMNDSRLALLKNIKLLLVEDNKTNQIVAMGVLEDYIDDMDIANDGQEAVDMVLKKEYDIILMDLQMPVMGGFEATKLIRENEIYKDKPIIALSAAVMKEDLELTKRAGMNGHLAKPIDKNKLLEMLLRYSE